MNISLEGLNCPATPTGVFNITNHTSAAFIDLNPGNVTIDNDKLTFFIAGVRVLNRNISYFGHVFRNFLNF